MISQWPTVKKQHLWLDVAYDHAPVITVPARLTGWDPDTWITVTIYEIYKLIPRICATQYALNDGVQSDFLFCNFVNFIGRYSC